MIFYLSKDTPAVQSNALRFLSEINPHKNWIVEIKQNDKPKTGQQRRYFHMLLALFEQETGNNAEAMKIEIKARILDPVKILVAGKQRYYLPSSESINVKQYGELIEAAQLLCMTHDITYPDPRDFGMKF